jgi:N-acetylglutamate synthase-like GNAT family acetyltransferase
LEKPHGGRRLARQQASRRGVASLYLLTTTAEPLFARWGFRRIERDAAPAAVRATKQFASLCPSSAVMMALALKGEASR